MTFRMNGDIAIFNVEADREVSLLRQVDDLVSQRIPFFVASVTYVDIEGDEFESIFVSARDEFGEIRYFAALLQPGYLPLPLIWEVSPAVWSVNWTPSSGIVFSSDGEKICALRCSDEEFLYDLVMVCEESYGIETASAFPKDENVSEDTSTQSEDTEMIELGVLQPLTMAEWFTQEYDLMTVDQILQNIDEWSVGVLRETYNHEQSRRMRPRVLSKIIEYLGFVGEDPRILDVGVVATVEELPQQAQSETTKDDAGDGRWVSIYWDAIDIEDVTKLLCKVERTSDKGRTWTHLGTTAATFFVDKKRKPETTDIYKLSFVDTSGTNYGLDIYSPIKAELSDDEKARYLVPFLGEISEDIRKKNARVMKYNRGTLQVHCPFCGSYTEKTISSNRKFNQAIDNTNRANDLQRKAQKRQRKAEKIIAMGDRLSFSAGGAMRANQIETNHLIQDQLRGNPTENFAHIMNDAEVECENCGELVDEI